MKAFEYYVRCAGCKRELKFKAAFWHAQSSQPRCLECQRIFKKSLKEKIKLKNKTVYVRWNPITEKVVCVHTTPEGSCPACDAAREEVVKAGYAFEEGSPFIVQSP